MEVERGRGSVAFGAVAAQREDRARMLQLCWILTPGPMAPIQATVGCSDLHLINRGGWSLPQGKGTNVPLPCGDLQRPSNLCWI